jgi:hypothetical protein
MGSVTSNHASTEKIAADRARHEEEGVSVWHH